MRLLLACALIASAACAHLPRPVEEPTATVRSAELRPAAASLLGRVTLDVFNPNPVGLPLRTVAWELWVGEGQAANGLVELDQTIPARGSAPVEAVVRVGVTEATAALARIASGERRYRLRGVLRFATSLATVNVPFDVTGEVGG